MEHNTQGLICRALIICLSIVCGVLIAFTLFRKAPEKERYGAYNTAQMDQAFINTLVSHPDQAVEPVQDSRAGDDYAPVERAQASLHKEDMPVLLEHSPAPLEKQVAMPVAVSTDLPVSLTEPQALIVEPVAVQKPVSRTVVFKNNIKKEMTGYKKFGKTWYPDEYSLSINGIVLGEGEELAMKVDSDNRYMVIFSYDFRPMGRSYKKGTEELVYTLADTVSSVVITFSWYEKPNIIVQGT